MATPFKTTSLFAAIIALPFVSKAANEPDSVVPGTAPRTMILSGRVDEFREFCLSGEGAETYSIIKRDLDELFMDTPFPDEPLTYGDPEPKKRDTYKADKWRNVQDVTGMISGLAEAAMLAWRVTGEERYLEKAKEFLLGSTTWHFDPDWESGDVPGATDIYYNDEGNFRLWRKLPLIYDQLRDELTDEEREQVLAHFRIRGNRTVKWIRDGNVEALVRNSLEVEPRSHHVRFMAMVGLTALALWDDLPESRDWWNFAYTFYRDQFSPFGGDDGGWAEGNAYWRGTFEHAGFQDALLAIGDPIAYNTPFWRNTGYFAVYNVQPYLHTTFGDASNAGHFNLEPVVSEYLEHLGRVRQDGYLIAYAAQEVDDPRPPPSQMGLKKLDRTYPTAGEFLIRKFIASALPRPAPKPLSELKPYRFFKDVGWVSMHSDLGNPENDIHITFKSSPYGSYSHSHADQNSFIINAFGEGLAINSANREFHRSPHHKGWTWQTHSKNAVLVDGLGQKSQDKNATGKITRFETGDRYALATGDAKVAYNSTQPFDRIDRITRDLLFVDRHYVVTRDVVKISDGATLSWLLHAARSQGWDNQNRSSLIQNGHATLTTRIVSPDTAWHATITDRYPVPIDPRYFNGETYTWVTAQWQNHVTLTLESADASKEFEVFAVLWPEKNGFPADTLVASLAENGVLIVERPDGKTDRITLTDSSVQID